VHHTGVRKNKGSTSRTLERVYCQLQMTQAIYNDNHKIHKAISHDYIVFSCMMTIDRSEE